MRLVEVAKKLGMTGQELRRELAKVEFGVKPTDREVPDQLAQGIIRFIAKKYNIEVKSDDLEEGEEEEVKVDQEEEEQEVASEENPSVDSRKKSVKDGESKKKVRVLRKLTLEDVSDDAVRAQQKSNASAGRGRAGGGRRGRSTQHKKHAQKRKEDVLKHQVQIKRKEGVIEVPETITVKEFSEKAGIQVADMISVLMKNGMMATINQNIDFDTAAIVASELNIDVKRAEVSVSAEQLIAGDLASLLQEDSSDLLEPRPPVVTVMGHVDHGKTAILDAIRNTDVVSGEAGGITQHIGAYQVEHDGKHVTLLDTPGHEAFTAMRARGAQITDIVVLVVAADEGVKPTTVEAIDHAKDAGVPILVAINKIDKEGADPDRVKGELAGHELQSEDWGGKTPMVHCSAKTGAGINDILDHILLLAEMEELKANPNRNAVATVIEAHLDPSLGAVASLVVNAGQLHVGDSCICGSTYGKVKAMMDDHGRRVQAVGPSGVVRISGLSDVPESGDILQVAPNEQEAKRLLVKVKEAKEAARKRGLGDLISRISEGRLTTLKIVLKADSQGSLGAVEKALSELKASPDSDDSGKGIVPKVIHAAVGAVTEGDVMMAAASGGIVLGFNVSHSTHVEQVAERYGVQVRHHDIIYNLLEEVESLLKGLIEPEEKEEIVGHLNVLGVFFRKRSEQVVGGKVTDGSIKRLPFRLMRDEKEVAMGRVTSVRMVEKDIKEAKEGTECGLRIDCSMPIEEGDVIEVYVRQWKKA